jgi:hypothetical protein
VRADGPYVVFAASYPQNVGFILLILPVGAGKVNACQWVMLVAGGVVDFRWFLGQIQGWFLFLGEVRFAQAQEGTDSRFQVLL